MKNQIKKLELKRQIHSALIDANGSLPDVAKRLGMERKQLYAAIHKDRDLKLRWATSSKEVAPPRDVVVIDRPCFPGVTTGEAVSEQESIATPRRFVVRERANKVDATNPILDHYCRVGLDAGWTRDRFHRLCQLLNATTREVLAICRYSNRDMVEFKKWLKPNHIPPWAALGLALLEDAYFNAVCGFKRDMPLVPVNLIA